MQVSKKGRSGAAVSTDTNLHSISGLGTVSNAAGGLKEGVAKKIDAVNDVHEVPMQFDRFNVKLEQQHVHFLLPKDTPVNQYLEFALNDTAVLQHFQSGDDNCWMKIIGNSMDFCVHQVPAQQKRDITVSWLELELLLRKNFQFADGKLSVSNDDSIAPELSNWKDTRVLELTTNSSLAIDVFIPETQSVSDFVVKQVNEMRREGAASFLPSLFSRFPLRDENTKKVALHQVIQEVEQYCGLKGELLKRMLKSDGITAIGSELGDLDAVYVSFGKVPAKSQNQASNNVLIDYLTTMLLVAPLSHQSFEDALLSLISFAQRKSSLKMYEAMLIKNERLYVYQFTLEEIKISVKSIVEERIEWFKRASKNMKASLQKQNTVHRREDASFNEDSMEIEGDIDATLKLLNNGITSLEIAGEKYPQDNDDDCNTFVANWMSDFSLNSDIDMEHAQTSTKANNSNFSVEDAAEITSIPTDGLQSSKSTTFAPDCTSVSEQTKPQPQQPATQQVEQHREGRTSFPLCTFLSITIPLAGIAAYFLAKLVR